jgi:polyphenol oxidase
MHDASHVVVPDWPAPARVRALTTTRTLPGNSTPPYDAFNLGLRSGDDESIVRGNRALLARAFALPSTPCWLRQVHGARVAQFDAPTDSEIEADAAVTSRTEIVLAIQTADCLPILFSSDDGHEIAALHAGWRGLAANVIGACVGAMKTPRDRLLAWLGPAIGPKSYEVGVEVRAAFTDRDKDAAAAFEPTRDGHWFCDLYRIARSQLRTAGIERIFGGGFDTLVDQRFYSYRRDGSRSGRMASLIWREDDKLIDALPHSRLGQ